MTEDLIPFSRAQKVLLFSHESVHFLNQNFWYIKQRIEEDLCKELALFLMTEGFIEFAENIDQRTQNLKIHASVDVVHPTKTKQLHEKIAEKQNEKAINVLNAVRDKIANFGSEFNYQQILKSEVYAMLQEIHDSLAGVTSNEA